MSELKTLKDLEENKEAMYFQSMQGINIVSDLREEAQKYVEHYENHENKVGKDLIVPWIKTFFDLGDEE